MAQRQGIRNYRVLRDISLGSLAQNSRPLTPLTAIIGENGSGKSSLIDALCFLSVCLKHGPEDACDARGGFDGYAPWGKRALWS